MQKGVKFRIYPNKEQQTIINQTLGCCRLIYNKGLAMRNEAYQNGNKIGYSQTSAMLTDLKKSDGFAFLKAVDSKFNTFLHYPNLSFCLCDVF